MAEEQRCQEGHRLCANNCGFFGSPATLNLCSKCYRDFRLKEEQASSAKVAVEKSLQASSSSSSYLAVTEPSADVRSPLALSAPAAERVEASPAAAAEGQAPAASRCTACRKRVVQVPVRAHVLRGPPVPGAARVRVRLQGGGAGGHRTCQPRGQGRQARKDLRCNLTFMVVYVICEPSP